MGVQIPPWKGAIFGERPIVKYREGHSAVICAQTAEPMVMPFGLWARTDPRNRKLNGAEISPWEGTILGERGEGAVQKRLNRSICHLGYGLGWAEGSTSSIVFARCFDHLFKFFKCQERPSAVRRMQKTLWPPKLHRGLHYSRAYSASCIPYLVMRVRYPLPGNPVPRSRLLKNRALVLWPSPLGPVVWPCIYGLQLIDPTRAVAAYDFYFMVIHFNFRVFALPIC